MPKSKHQDPEGTSVQVPLIIIFETQPSEPSEEILSKCGSPNTQGKASTEILPTDKDISEYNPTSFNTVDFMDEGAHLNNDGDSDGLTTTVPQANIQLAKNILASYVMTLVSTPPPSTFAKDLATTATASPQTDTHFQSAPFGIVRMLLLLLHLPTTCLPNDLVS